MPGCLRHCLRRAVLVTATSCLAGCSGTAALRHTEPVFRCRDGACEPHCPAHPETFGYHATHWRKWPQTTAATSSRPDDATPAAPPKSAVPRADEESPRPPTTELPPPAAIRLRPAPAAPDPPAGNADVPPAPRLAAEQRTASLAAEATAALAGTAGQRDEFTRRLVSLLLAESAPEARARIVEVAARFRTPAADSICRGAVQDPDPLVRAAACAAWARRGGAEAVALLAERYHADSELSVRLRALWALGELGDTAALPVLAHALDDTDPAVRYRAMHALRRISGRDLGDDPARWRAWVTNPDDRPARWSITEPVRRMF